MHYPDLMIDLETLGLHNDNRMVILSIGAVAFNIEEVESAEDIPTERTFHNYLDMHAQIRRGRRIDPDTVLWWLGQDHAAQVAIVEGQRQPRAVEGVLSNFQTFTRHYGIQQLWGNGSDFDCKALRTLFDDFGMHCAIPRYGNRCMRTLKNLYRDIFKVDQAPYVPIPDRIAHNALSDALHQTLITQRMYQELSHGTKAGDSIQQGSA